MNLHPYSFREISHPYERHQLGLRPHETAFNNVHTGDTLVFQQPLYREPVRPVIQFSPFPVYQPRPMIEHHSRFLTGPGDRI